MFRRAEARRGDRLCRQARVRQLVNGRLPQVQSPVAGAIRRKPGRSLGGSGEERPPNAVVNLIAARSNARADDRDEIARRHTVLLESLDRRADDSCATATPAGMDGRNRTTPSIGQQDRHAIGHTHGHSAIGIEGDDGVGLDRRLPDVAGPDHVHGPAMHLRDLNDVVRSRGRAPRPDAASRQGPGRPQA